MQIGLVLGNARSTIKHESLDRKKLLVIQPLMVDGESPDGPPLLAVDPLGAGAGEKVIMSADGGAVAELFDAKNTPIRWVVIGLADQIINP